MKLADARREYLAAQEVRGLSPATLELRRIMLDEFIGSLRDRGLEAVEEVTREHVEAYRAWMLAHISMWTGRKLAISSVSHRLWTVKAFFADLMKRKVLAADPTRELVWPKVPVHLPRRVPTEKQMEDILARPDVGTTFGLRDRTILEVFYATGIRREELARLDLYDINLNERTLCVRQGKGGKGRTVPLTGTACEFLARYLKESRPQLVRSRGVRRAGAREPALFVSLKGERFKKYHMGQMVGRYVRAVAPGTEMTCHAIRRAFATHMLQGGAHPVYIQRMLGHASLQMTERYTQLKPVDLKEAHRRHHPSGRLKEG
jgi:integrase/recombinase XerD